MNPKLLIAFGVAILGPLCALPIAAQDRPPKETPAFSARIGVSLVTVPIRARIAEGGPIALSADDLEVLEDGVSRRVVALESLAGAVAKPEIAEGSPPLTSPVGSPRPEVVLYIDVPFAGHRMIDSAARWLDRSLEDLLLVGPMTIVVANPSPEVQFEHSTDRRAIRKALVRLRKEAPALGEVERIRRDLLREDLTIGGRQRLGFAATEEAGRIEERRRWLATWIATRPATVAPGILLLVSGAYDSDPVDFYVNQMCSGTGMLSETAVLRSDLSHLAQGPADEQLGIDLAASGWTVFPIVPTGVISADFRSASESGHAVWRAFASSQPGAPSSPFIFTHALAGWTTLSAPSGGTTVTSDRALGELVGDLAESQLLTYERVDPEPGRTYELEVRSRRMGVEISAPRWRSESTPAELALLRARAALESGEASGELGLRIEGIEVLPSSAVGEARVAVTLGGLRPLVPVAGRQSPGWVLSIVARSEDGSLAFRSEGVREPAGPLRVELRIPATTTALGLSVEEIATGAWGAEAVWLTLPR